MNVLIIEDEKSLAKEIRQFLEKEYYLCELALTGNEASEKIAVNLYDFILLDLGLPDYDGLDLLEEAKKANPDAAYIIITARGQLEDRIKGLDLGADDYLAKPFSLLELSARMQAVNRRKHGLKNNIISAKEFEIDLSNRKIYFQGQQEVIITKKEFDLVSYLVLHKNKVLTRLQLTEHIWGNILEDDFDSNYIDVHIKNIRKKLSSYTDISWLETVRGVGYRANL